MDIKVYDKKPSQCNCLNLRRASHAITEVYDDFLAPSGLKLGQFSLLKHIDALGPVSVSNLAISIRLDRTTLVRNLKPLEERGYINDIAIEGTRNRQLKLTDKGKEVYKSAELLWLKAQNYLDDYLGKDNLEVFTTLLSKIEALVP
ncbi:transcriptional regulator [Clostridium zeae]|uniref:Transcriptional regulator n=1 Tax=Clostridium zeae TaxID=2759022 RepID=A0ABQ1E508_9CLOT|nr:MarR family winged helix-turn-helix transcriptional regulator [Clostridium zeae]GFZ29825.1 transcriptional regulator [Clostridium zeae]